MPLSFFSPARNFCTAGVGTATRATTLYAIVFASSIGTPAWVSAAMIASDCEAFFGPKWPAVVRVWGIALTKSGTVVPAEFWAAARIIPAAARGLFRRAGKFFMRVIIAWLDG